MSKGTVQLVIDLYFEGDYYGEDERADVAGDWISRGLEDRDNLVGWKILSAEHYAGGS